MLASHHASTCILSAYSAKIAQGIRSQGACSSIYSCRLSRIATIDVSDIAAIAVSHLTGIQTVVGGKIALASG
jgi:hypothetical protein